MFNYTYNFPIEDFDSQDIFISNEDRNVIVFEKHQNGTLKRFFGSVGVSQFV